MPLGTLEDRCDERHVARCAEGAELPQAQAVGEHEDHLSNAVTERRLERAQRRRVGVVANAEHIEHRGRDVEEPATVVVRWNEAARA